MYINIYHVLYKGNLINETGIKEKIDSLIDKYISELLEERKTLKLSLKEIDKSFKKVHAPSKLDTPETYKKFIRNTYPELFYELEKIGPIIFKGQVVMGTFISSPTNYGWYVTNNKGETHLLDFNEALLELTSKILRTDFSIKEVIVEIP